MEPILIKIARYLKSQNQIDIKQLIDHVHDHLSKIKDERKRIYISIRIGVMLEKYFDWTNQQIQKEQDELKKCFKIILPGEICDYCKGSGYDPYPNHDTVQRPCPVCKIEN